MKNQSRFVVSQKTILIMLISVFAFTATSCTPLKKKFTRRKKDGPSKDKFIPVLEPVDYSEVERSVQKKYAAAYSLWKIWQRDLLEDIERDRSSKNQKYLLSEIVVSLEKMKKLLEEGLQNELNTVIQGYSQLLDDYARLDSFHQKKSIERRVNALGKTIRSVYTPRLLTEESYQN